MKIIPDFNPAPTARSLALARWTIIFSARILKFLRTLCLGNNAGDWNRLIQSGGYALSLERC